MLEAINTLYSGFKIAYGSPRIHEDFRRKYILVRLPKVIKIMPEKGIKSCMNKKFKPPYTTVSNHIESNFANLLNQDLTVKVPNIIYATDIKYFPYAFGIQYLREFKNRYTRKVLGGLLILICDLILFRALKKAIAYQKPNVSSINHSNKGSQHAGWVFREEIEKHGFIQSMSRNGNCSDNAPAESFFSKLKREFTNHQSFKNLEVSQSTLLWYIEGFCKTTRLNSSIGYQTPVMLENEFYVCV